MQDLKNPNRTAFNLGGKLHTEYRFLHSAWTVGASYFGAEPFDANGTLSQFNSKVDNTLPGFELSTFGEAYLQYKSRALQAKLGDQILDTPWANPSDSRIKPVAFQGIDAKFTVSPAVTIGGTRMIRFEGRTSSEFDRNTLLTSRPAGNPSYGAADSSGFLLADAIYNAGSRLSAGIYDYKFYDIATMLYGVAKYYPIPASRLKPYLAAQYVSERQDGRALAGIIRNDTFGAQLGASFGRNVDFALGYDEAPWRTADIAASSCATAVKGYFVPVGGTPNCTSLGGGLNRVYYGGIASPYTEAYATDPLFTTSISQGNADRHSAGDSWKAAATLQTNDKRTKAVLSRAHYNYGNGAGANTTYETDIDVTYFFNKVPSGPYRGFSIRHRYAERSQPTLPFDFKYNRTQFEYDF